MDSRFIITKFGPRNYQVLANGKFHKRHIDQLWSHSLEALEDTSHKYLDSLNEQKPPSANSPTKTVSSAREPKTPRLLRTWKGGNCYLLITSLNVIVFLFGLIYMISVWHWIFASPLPVHPSLCITMLSNLLPIENQWPRCNTGIIAKEQCFWIASWKLKNQKVFPMLCEWSALLPSLLWYWVFIQPWFTCILHLKTKILIFHTLHRFQWPPLSCYTTSVLWVYPPCCYKNKEWSGGC